MHSFRKPSVSTLPLLTIRVSIVLTLSIFTPNGYVKPRDGQFIGPPEVPTPRTDGYSSGDNTWLTASTKSFMEYSVAGMVGNQSMNVEESHLDRAWENRTTDKPTQYSTKSGTPSTRSSDRTYTSYADATVSDQVSGMTESEPPRDIRHEELTNKIAILEAMIAQLSQRVQALTNPSAPTQQALKDKDDNFGHREKRLDQRESPRKHKQAQQYSAPSRITGDTIETGAPMDEDRPTVWDDYLATPDDDL